MNALLERFDRPWCLWLVLVIVLMAWLSRRSLSGLGPTRRRLALAARFVVVVLLVLAMAGMHRILKNDELTVLFLLDQSRSIPSELRREAEVFVKTAAHPKSANDRVAILTFDGQTSIEQLPNHGGPEGAVHVPTPFADGNRPDRTNIAQGLRMAAACAPETTANRIVILSDGNQNIGDALEEAKTSRANHMTVDVVPLAYARQSEVVFEKLRVPAYAHLHEQAALRLILRSDRRTTGDINLYQRVGPEEKLIDLDQASNGSGQRVTLAPGRNAFTVKLPIKTPRAHAFRAEFVPDDPSADATRENNVARAFTNVEGPAKVLFIGTQRDQEDDQLLVGALREEDIRVEYATAESASLDPAFLQDYAAVILSNTPADPFSAGQQQALANYVRDLGGGLIMIGGDEGFGAGGWQGSVVEDLMPVRFDVDAVRQIPRGALAIVMHSCEMPQGNKWGIETAVAALKTISRLDYYGVIGSGVNGFHWEVPMQVASNKDAILQRIRRMQNADMFDFDSPMRMAFQALMNKKDAASRHMIIISDGDPAPPSSGLLNQMVGNKVSCSTVMIFPHGGGMTTMRSIAKRTGGTYYLLQKPGDEKRLPRIFTKEAKVVRRPLIRDEVFTPKVRPNLSDIMAGIDEGFPELKGYVVTTPRKVVDVEMPLITAKGDPLLAHWQCGFGRTVAFTSGRWKHWGANWPGWPSFSKLWAQAVRWCMQQGTAADYDVATTIEGDVGHVVIETLSEEEGFANFRRFNGRLIRPDGTSALLPVMQTGPGHYEATFEVKDRGTYLVNVRAEGTASERPANIRTGVTVAFSPEFRDVSTNKALLRQIAAETNGKILSLDDPDPEQVFSRLAPTIARKPIWNTLLKLAVFCFLLDVAVRRIAIDPVKALARTRGYIASLPGRVGSGRRAEAILTNLKGVRDRVRTERTARAAGDVPPESMRGSTAAGPDAGPDSTAPDASARFTAGAAKRPTGGLAQVIGGAQAAPSSDKSDSPAKAKDEPPQEPTTARLLKARKKRRKDSGEDGA